jgi:tetratricopeptide (TPR) repeat protein
MTDRRSRRARAERLLAAGLFTFFAAAICWTARLAWAEGMFRQNLPAAFVGNAVYYEGWAEREPTHERDALLCAVAADPRDSSAWISLGLAAEGAGEWKEAARDFEAAERVDRQYLPAWSSANFFFRHGDISQFWRAAARAAAMAQGDLAPLIDLVDKMESDATVALSHLGPTPRLERAYLDFLIGKGRWDGAQSVAWRILAHRDPLDAARLLGLADRLLAAGRGDGALALCRKIINCPAPDPAAGRVLTNGNLEFVPTGHGFDWRVTVPRTVGVRWESGRLVFQPSGSEPDEYALLEQSILMGPRRYRLRFEYRTPGTGLRWVTSQKGLAEQSSPTYAAAEIWRKAEWSFAAQRAGLARLRLVYRREPGSTRIAGDAGVRHLSLEIL